MAKRKKEYVVHVAYADKYYRRYDDVLEDLVGKDSDGSGLGMGTRDMDWAFDSVKAAIQAAERIDGAQLAGVRSLYVSEVEPNGDGEPIAAYKIGRGIFKPEFEKVLKAVKVS